MANVSGNYFEALGLAATGVGPDVWQVRNHNADGAEKRCTLWVTGTFVGTITLEGSRPGQNAWGTISGATFTTPTSIGLRFACDEDVRVNMTAFTSGAADVRLHVY